MGKPDLSDLSWGYLDSLVNTDPIALRDIAFKLVQHREDMTARLRALAAVEEFIGEGCGNASHNIRGLLAGDDPRDDAAKWGLDF